MRTTAFLFVRDGMDLISVALNSSEGSAILMQNILHHIYFCGLRNPKQSDMIKMFE
ncbi:MAG: hypothetical protein QME73_02155 [Bacillota bacterium]|nr:hypothetical protein [Bacillota bacterium]